MAQVRGRAGGPGAWGVAAMLAAALAAGCDGAAMGPGGERTVTIPVAGGEGVKEVQCASVEGGGVLAMVHAGAPDGPQEDSRGLELLPGTLLQVGLREKEDPAKEHSFCYIWPGRPSRLVFGQSGPVTVLNGEPVCLDLSRPGADEWLRSAGRGKLGSIRSVLLSGKPGPDVLALTKLAGAGIVVELREAYPAAHRATLVKALLAARPAAIVAPDPSGLEEAVAGLKDLTHLVLAGKGIPDLTGHRRLRSLHYKLEKAKHPSLAPVAGLTQLRALSIEGCHEVRDFTPVGRLKGLRCLTLGDCKRLEDLAVLEGLTNLRTLTIGGAERLADLSPLAKLTNLRELAITPIPDGVKDLTPLTKLKGLEVLVVDKEGLNQRKAEYDEVRKALPETEIVGFCAGSWLMVPIVSAGAAAGLAARRRRAARRGRT